MEDIRIPNEPEIVHTVRMKILEHFQDLQFEAEGHRYFLHGEEYAPVSTVVQQFEEPFEAEKHAEAYAQRNGQTKAYWLDEWRRRNLRATITGTLVHEFGESVAWLRAGHPERITASCQCKYCAEKDWLIPTRPKEEAVLKFWEELDPHFYFVLAEAKVYSGSCPEAAPLQTKMAGTFDILFYYLNPDRPEVEGLYIFDYKTNRDLEDTHNRRFGRQLRPPFSDFPQEPKSLYSLQLSCYQIPLEDIGMTVRNRVLVWLKDDGTYEKFPLPDMTDRLKEVL